MVDPRMPSDATEPSYAANGAGAFGRLFAEAWDHLWPWNRRAPQGPRAMQAAGAAYALAVTVAWVLAAMGELRAGAIIGWWLGWSVYEVVIRLGAKRYVKDGPWWGRRYRVASVMDMICYVGFKNLLIGAALFLVLRGLDRLVI